MKTRGKSEKPKKEEEKPKPVPPPKQAEKRKTKGRSISPDEEKENKKVKKSTPPQDTPNPKPKPKSPDQKSPTKMVKAVVKGNRAVDPHFPGLGNYRVYTDASGKSYDATMNQSNVNHNNNKYYIIQVVEDESQINPNSKYYFYNRWGRVGFIAGTTKKGPMSLDSAIREYNIKFQAKAVSGDYRVLEISNDSKEEEAEEEVAKPKKARNDYEESKLHKSLKDLLTTIFDLKMMNNYMKEIGYDAKKLPLGKLSKSNMDKGYEILRKLSDLMKSKKGNKNAKSDSIAELSNDFYSYIPHDFGFQFIS